MRDFLDRFDSHADSLSATQPLGGRPRALDATRSVPTLDAVEDQRQGEEVSRSPDRGSDLYRPHLSQPARLGERGGQLDVDSGRLRALTGQLPQHASGTAQPHQGVDHGILGTVDATAPR